MEQNHIEAQLKLVKWIFGGVMGAFMVVVGYVYTQGSDISALKQDIKFQEILIFCWSPL